MIVGDSGVDREEGEGGDIFVEPQRVLPVLIKQGKGGSSLYCYIIGGECCLEGFLDLGPVLVSVCNMLVFKLGKPSLSKSFSLSLGYPIEENHSLCFIRELVCINGKVSLHGHEPSVGISSFSTELFREDGFDVHHVVVVFII